MDKYKLEYEMKKRKISQEELCKKIHISRSAFYRKCNGLSEFTQSEIQAIIDFLELESPMGIFFTEKHEMAFRPEGGELRCGFPERNSRT